MRVRLKSTRWLYVQSSLAWKWVRKLQLMNSESQIKMLVDGLVSHPKKKIHLADFTQEEKNAVIDAVSRLEFTAKIWIHYASKNPTVAKIDALRSTVVALQKKHSKAYIFWLSTQPTIIKWSKTGLWQLVRTLVSCQTSAAILWGWSLISKSFLRVCIQRRAT